MLIFNSFYYYCHFYGLFEPCSFFLKKETLSLEDKKIIKFNNKTIDNGAIDLKKDADSELILNYLYKNTDLMISYSYNMVSIVNRRPMTLGLVDMLDAYIKHQKEVVLKRTNFDLEVAKKRLHIVDGLIKALSILDEVIATNIIEFLDLKLV